MSTETTPAPTEATPTATRGMQLPCPCCGEASAVISLNLADGETLSCQECSTDFTVDDVRRFIALWAPVVAWIRSMPTPAQE